MAVAEGSGDIGGLLFEVARQVAPMVVPIVGVVGGFCLLWAAVWTFALVVKLRAERRAGRLQVDPRGRIDPSAPDVLGEW